MMPTPGDGFMVFSFALFALINIAPFVQLRFGFIGIGMVQLIFLAIAMVFAFCIKADIKKLFSLKVPSFRHMLGSFVLWMGSLIIMFLLSDLLKPILDANGEAVDALNTALAYDNIGIQLLVVAVLPSICEEALYRGIIYKAIENGRHSHRAIIISSILFGIMHLDPIRIPITAILGLVTAYVVYKSGSIFLAVGIHFVNNSFAILSDRIFSLFPQNYIEGMEQIPVIGWLGIGVLLIGGGLVFFREGHTSYAEQYDRKLENSP